MSHTTDFANKQIETAVAPPSKTAAALTLPSIAHFPVDALSWNDPVRLSHCTRTCSTAVTGASTILVISAGDGVVAASLSVTAVVNTSVATRAPPSTLPGTQSNNYLHSRRHQPGMPQRRDSLVETAVDKMPRGLVGIRAEKATRAMTRSPWKQRTVIVFRSGTFRNQVLD